MAQIISPFSGVLVLAGCGLAGFALLRAFRAQPDERLQAAGFVCWLAATLLLAAGIGWGRAFMGQGIGFVDRYMLLMSPMWCAFSLVWTAYTLPKSRKGTVPFSSNENWDSPRWEKPLQFGLVLLLGVSALVGAHKGFRYAADVYIPLQPLERDAREGLPPAAAPRPAMAIASPFAQRRSISLIC